MFGIFSRFRSKAPDESSVFPQNSNQEPLQQTPLEVPQEESKYSPELQRRLDEIDRIRGAVNKFQNTISETRNSTTASETQLSNIHEFIRRAENDIDRLVWLEDENVTLRAKVEEFRDELQRNIEKFTAEQSLAQSLKERSRETREALQQAHVDISQHVQRVQLLQTQLEESQTRAGEQTIEVQNLLELNTDLEAESVRNRVALQQSSEEITNAKQLIAEFERERDEWKRVHVVEGDRREQLNIDLKDTRAKLKEALREKIDVETRLELSINDLDTRSKHFKEQIRSKDDRIYALESKTEALEAQSRVTEHSIEQLKAENRELLKTLASDDERQRSLKQQLAEMKTSNNADREKLFGSVHRISELEIRISSLVDDKEQITSENIAFSQVIDRLTHENKQLSERIILLNAIEEKYNKFLLRQDDVVAVNSADEEDDDELNVVKFKTHRKNIS